MSAIRTLFAASLVLAIGCGGSTVDATNGNNGGDDSGSGDANGGNDGTTGDSSAQNDSGGGDSGGGGTIQCGKATCDAQTEVCCVTQQGESCTAPNACQGLALPCSGTQSCPNGEVCCGQVQGYQQPPKIQCEPQCQQGMGNFQLCQSDSECPKGEKCRNGYGGFKVCAPSYDGGPPPWDGGPPKDGGVKDGGSSLDGGSIDGASSDAGGAG